MAVKNRLIHIKASGMMCSFCTMSVEKALARVPGVNSVQVNLVHGIILVDADPARVTEQQVAKKVEDLGYTVVDTEAQQVATDDALFATIRRRGGLAMGLAIADLLSDPINLAGLPERMRALVSAVVAIIVLTWIGYPILRKTLMALSERVINANVLLSTGAWGAFAIGVGHLLQPTAWPNFFPVAIWLMALHLFFGAFKLGTRKRAAESVRRLLSLQAQSARVMRGGHEVDVPVADVTLGELVAVRPGELVPLDGVVREGSSSFDMASVTGESVPVFREVGGEVVGGTMNVDGFVRVEVTRLVSEGFVAQVVGLMRQIEERKPPIQLLMDRLMNYYGPVVYAVAAVAFVGWLVYSGSVQHATLIALTVIIMGYPCALGITTPMVLAIGGGHGIARGLLVRAGEFFQALAEVDTVVFDKTGTLTYGRPTVREAIPFTGSEQDLLLHAASAEAGSEHPLAGAIVRYAQFQEIRHPDATDFRAVPGKGVVASVGGRRVVVGRPSFLTAEGTSASVPTAHEERVRALEAGHSVVYVAADGQLLGVIALQDTPRPDTARLMARLKAMGLRTAMLTGDSRSVAQAVARDIGLDDVHAELLPQEKVDIIARLQAEGRTVAFVGDGINDAPALVQSDVGIALGAGTDVAMQSAGVVLVSDKLDKVASAIILGRASHQKMRHNIAIAVTANVIGMTLAIVGAITAPLAIGIMAVSVLGVLASTAMLVRLQLDEQRGDDESDSNTEVMAPDVSETVIPARRMHCDACARRIDTTLAKIDGVRSVKANAIRKEVVVAYEAGRVTEEQLRGELETMGMR